MRTLPALRGLICGLFAGLCLFPIITPAKAEVVIHQETGEPGRFAAAEINQANEGKPIAAKITLAIATDKTDGPQSYRVERDGDAVRVLGADPAGAMYGGLDVAEAIRNGELPALRDSRHRPHILRRGIKFNIPLDLRTPSYSDAADAAQANIPEVWEKDFWIEFLDAMARNRYNVLSLWSLHPFPSMVRVPEYPEVALDDVWRTKVKLDDGFSFTGKGYVRPEMLANHEVVKRISMDEKIAFWRWMMRQAADRGITVYVFTWNVFTYGANGKHGITDEMGNDITKAYFRASVREMVKTYPLLGGMGITAGEGMPDDLDSRAKEKWLWDTYGEGVRDGLKGSPSRDFNLIHRFHWTSQGEILEAFKDYPGTFDFSFKYSVAHMYSIPNPPFIRPLMEGIAPGRRTWLTIRNDDLYTFRFGDPAYARDYVLNIPPADKIAGFYMGPDGYTWGREFLEREPIAGKRQLVLDKQWYAFMTWGRLAYEPSLPDSTFIRALATRHPAAPAGSVFDALQGASQIMPLITRCHWGDIDLKWYPEACWSHPKSKTKGFHDVREFIEGDPMPGSLVISIREWRQNVAAKRPHEGRTPVAIADDLDAAAEKTFGALERITDAARTDAELRKTTQDCEALAWLGRYYAAKLRGACDLALYDASSTAEDKTKAIGQLTQALAHWRRYAEIRDRHYLPALYNRVGFVDVKAITKEVAADIDLAMNWQTGSVRAATKQGGTEKGFRK